MSYNALFLRLKEFDYNSAGYYFVTIYTLDRKCLLRQIGFVGSADPCAPQSEVNTLSDYGKTADKYLQTIEEHNNGVQLDKYVIMPNHIHAIIVISNSGGQGSAHPTNSTLSNIIHSFKRSTNKEYGFNIWQSSFYDHIIRNEQDYLRIWEYIDTNVVKWADDEYFM